MQLKQIATAAFAGLLLSVIPAFAEPQVLPSERRYADAPVKDLGSRPIEYGFTR